jgi:hypothetical protein
LSEAKAEYEPRQKERPENRFLPASDDKGLSRTTEDKGL